MVPPRGRIPEIARASSGVNVPSTIPRQPSRTPTTSCPRSRERRVTARMTAFSPGQSPPPVRIPTRFDTNGVVPQWLGLWLGGLLRWGPRDGRDAEGRHDRQSDPEGVERAPDLAAGVDEG